MSFNPQYQFQILSSYHEYTENQTVHFGNSIINIIMIMFLSTSNTTKKFF